MLIKVACNKYYKHLDIEPYTNDSYKVKFRYDPELVTLIKDFQGARWHPEEKFWTIGKSARNRFTLEYLTGKDVYARYKQPIKTFIPKRNELMAHQIEMLGVMLTYKRVIVAAAMGTGKTLAAIECMEKSGFYEWLYVAPKAGIRAVELELLKWCSYIWPTMVTYDGLKKLVANHNGPAFKGVIFDEVQKIRNITTQRYQAAAYLVENMIREHDDPFIIELSGTPSPTDPTGWWSLSEIACAGYLKEPHPIKLKKRLALVRDEESLSGGWFPNLVTWWDDPNKCKVCGKLKEDLCHSIEGEVLGYEYHDFVQSKNEIEALYHRLKGLVHIWDKSILNLPEKIYRVINLQPTEEVLRAAKLIITNAKNTITALIQLRCLADGFLYQDVETGFKVCSLCHGKKTIEHPDAELLEECPSCEGKIEYQGLKGICVVCSLEFEQAYNENKEYTCPNCMGEGQEPVFQRQAAQIACPKEEALLELLDEVDEIGRIVVYAAFQGSVDRVTEICKNAGWEYVKFDGRGCSSSLGEISDKQMLREFQDKKRKIPRLAYCANSDSGGVAVTLTESPMAVYYSNSYVPESRLQSEDRIARIGMNMQRGATIVDLMHLPSDATVLSAVRKRQRLQSITLGELSKCYE